MFSVDSEGVWCQIRQGARREGPALFLDRDGVIMEEVGYLSRPEQVTMIPGAAEVIAMVNARGLAVVMVTNQARLSGLGFRSIGEPIDLY